MYKRFVLLGLLLVAFAAMASPAAAANTNCSGTLPAGVYDDVTVLPDDACTLTAAHTVTGNVKVKKNAYFEAGGTSIAKKIDAKESLTVFVHDGATVGKGVDAYKTAEVFLFDSSSGDKVKVEKTTTVVDVCGMSIDGDLEVKKSGQDILIGDPLAADCAGNSVDGNVKVEENSTDVELIIRGNTIEGDLNVKKNSGPSAKAVEGNTGGKTLDCKDNTAPFTASGNPGWEKKKGQCTAP